MSEGDTPLRHGPAGEDDQRGADEAPHGVEADHTGEDNLAQVSVTVDEEHLASLDQVVAELRERGLHVEAVLETLGMVTGSTADADLLREVEGVSGVDAQLEHRIPPPEEEIQ
ncbi:MAG: hypothetical protein ABR500_05985 [Dermatophilaceae bacterium]|nr:hypothetical protein [Intrasporangiaceae bacterium]